MKGAVLVVPACERGLGGGHLGRSLFIARALRERGREAHIFIPPHLVDDVLSRFQEFFESVIPGDNQGAGGKGIIISAKEELERCSWDCIVLDCFRTQAEDFRFWAALAPLVGIDEGGSFRRRFDFLIDLLPSPARHKPNLTAPRLLPLPRNRKEAARELPAKEEESSAPGQEAALPLRVLISFGAEDAAGLGTAAALSLVRAKRKKNETPPEITLVAPVPPPPAASRELEESGFVKTRGKVPKLREHLAEYSLLITHFGLGAFEALYARLPVLLLSPTSYHGKLGRAAGFFSPGEGAKGIRRLGNLKIDSVFLAALEKRRAETARRFGLEEDQKDDLGSFISGIDPRARAVCPLCGTKAGARGNPVIARLSEESYRRCGRCGVVYLARLTPPPVEYEREYFFGFYKKQYGKTYLEDFPKLVEAGRKRLAHIEALLRKPEAVPLLDIGCAYGPFLAAAAERGFSPVGLEPAEDAVRYVKEELKLPALRGTFPLPWDKDTGEKEGGEVFKEGSFGAVTLWYVIEHFEQAGEALREINRLLEEGGVLAFSTPSFSGISGRKNRRAFLEKSPPDHWTVWSPRICRKLFRQYGFRLRKTLVTGHHPERFPLLGRFVSPGNNGLLYRLLLFISRVLRLGDTFEAYGVKRQDRRN